MVIPLSKETLAILDNKPRYNKDCRKRVLEKLNGADPTAVFDGTTATNRRDQKYARWAVVEAAFW
jgi:hypothetical protein